ncbi:hypothetical protein [uncultured Nocardioides sp.]|jgi:membrane protein DedA with SNARE-associated domain|uniref:hypothetical protein n=1 Tax=uncultured Nocardioides sp. TaxID=198441 RepID=UPI002619ECDD|nr:hypothetical protein [uncultured Nocardioides sp.]HRD59348.1 hypothetical protein [Nocardioides sp.]
MNPGPFVAAIVCTAVWVAGGWVAFNVAQWVTSMDFWQLAFLAVLGSILAACATYIAWEETR